MNAEIVQRLEWALSLTSAPEAKQNLPETSGDIPWSMMQDISQLAHEAGVGFNEMLARIFVAGIHKDAPQVLYMPIIPGATMQDLRATMDAAKDFVRPDAAIVSEKVAYSVSPRPAKGSPESGDPSLPKPSTKRIPRTPHIKKNP